MRHIDAVVERNKAVGGNFFDQRTILYFKSKVLPTLYGDKYFITYDLMEDGNKLFSVRQVLANGRIKLVNKGYTYQSKAVARDAIHDLMGDVVTA